MPFFLHPRADDEKVAELKKALRDNDVQLSSVLPLYRWSSPDETERQMAVRYWRRMIKVIATVCVFAWEERVKESSAFMLERVTKELG